MSNDSTALAPDLSGSPGVGEGCSALALSRLACLRGRPEEAAGWLSLAEESCPRSSLVAEWAGQLAWAEGEREKALSQWLRDERGVVRLLLWAWLYLREGDADTSEFLLEAALPLADQELSQLQVAFAYDNLGIIHQNRGDWPQAVDAYKQAIALAPNRSEFWTKLGIALRSVNELNASLDALEQALLLASGGDARQLWVIYGQLARTHWELGQASEALDSYIRASCWSRQDPEFDTDDARRLDSMRDLLTTTFELDEAVGEGGSCP